MFVVTYQMLPAEGWYVGAMFRWKHEAEDWILQKRKEYSITRYRIERHTVSVAHLRFDK